jgi:hypothetical protein
MAYSNSEKAETLADTLESAFMPNNDPSNVAHIELVRKETRNLGARETNLDPMQLTNVRELMEAVKRLKNNKAPGIDNISNVVLKILPLAALETLTTNILQQTTNKASNILK